ncbi:N-acetylmuramoyl-L-alanine amidase [Ralstonia pickettii]|nr:N-acetylmuramoyl-L-alanine amidase [Ralstonia pickettii]
MKYLRYFLALILLLGLFLPAEITKAANGDTYEVSSMLLHVRDEPAGDATIMGLLHKGDRVTVFQEKYGWVQTYYAGQTAWVAKHHLVPVSTSNSSIPADSGTQRNTVSNDKLTVNASSVNIRSGPGLDYAVIAGTSSGETFTVAERSGDWAKITLANGNTGWIAAWLTTENTQSHEEETSTNVKTVSQKTTGSAPNQVSSQSLAGYNIVLDAGHGGKDPGAIGLGGIKEKDLVTSTASQIASTLRAHGATVIETRSGDYFLSLDERINISNAYDTHAFISVHFNAFPVVAAQGINTFYASSTSRVLASNVQNSLAASVSLNDRGIMQADYKVLRNTDAPAILMELGFITNAYDLSVIRTAEYQQQVGEAVADGLMNYFHN